jgi:hypothetical protein
MNRPFPKAMMQVVPDHPTHKAKFVSGEIRFDPFSDDLRKDFENDKTNYYRDYPFKRCKSTLIHNSFF